ncbi:Fanconi anemia core complex-associated protein 20 isoform X1 [Cervus canadensis]|uniref:Fanconi anemia core complex-associated protein 20 isoform X1 n=1 Tax=Cervus canadensis TaxID=1574408 RepID=UPI001C9E5CEC|nr:Fanconi anemia core complex-associated protein 20 isoform X1 [Cervus canadensis]XP_043341333.1 Fanconi anemia core complex-associated protein 20 isoform X1 [Cervus canadensis]
MEATRRSRLSLSRRKPPSGARAPLPACPALSYYAHPRRPRPPSNPPGSLPDGGECAKLWTQLLRIASADLNVDGELPPLPAFPGQEPSRSPERPPPERFTVGTETFFWTPFPPPPPGRGGDSGGSDLVLSAVRGRTGSPPKHPAPQLRGTPSAEEQPSEEQPSQRQPSVDSATTLQSCPMCQVDFAPGLAQLDVDSHLAQCLADSTDDIECPEGARFQEPYQRIYCVVTGATGPT